MPEYIVAGSEGPLVAFAQPDSFALMVDDDGRTAVDDDLDRCLGEVFGELISSTVLEAFRSRCGWVGLDDHRGPSIHLHGEWPRLNGGLSFNKLMALNKDGIGAAVVPHQKEDEERSKGHRGTIAAGKGWAC